MFRDFISHRQIIPRKAYGDIELSPNETETKLSTKSPVIDLIGIDKKYRRVPRKITLEQFLNCYTYSAMLKAGLSLLSLLPDGKITCFDYRQSEKLNRDTFWTNNGMFLWQLHYGKWGEFWLTCEIGVINEMG